MYFLHLFPIINYLSLLFLPSVSQVLRQVQAEAQGLQREIQRYQEAVKKAFMRGVCSLNMEALGMFHSGPGGEVKCER